MIKEELIKRSPVRLFEKSLHGGLEAGEIGIIAAPSGIGKTSVLVQIALDKLLQEKKVIHVSFIKHTDYIFSWYRDIFDEFTKKKNLEHAEDVKGEIVKNRIILNFNQDGVTGEKILKSLRALIVEGGFTAPSIIIDGFDFSETNRRRMEEVKTFAKEYGISFWYSCNVNEDQFNKQKIPFVVEEYLNLVDILIVLEPGKDHIKLSASKDRNILNSDLTVALDPRTLLILAP